MNKKVLIIAGSILGLTVIGFSGYLIYKSFSQGFKNDDEHDTYLMLYIIALGLPYNEENIDKYYYMSTEELKYEIEKIENQEPTTNEEFFNP